MKWLRFSCWLNGHALIKWGPNAKDVIECRCGQRAITVAAFHRIYR